jgi:hypothetical protein
MTDEERAREEERRKAQQEAEARRRAEEAEREAEERARAAEEAAAEQRERASAVFAESPKRAGRPVDDTTSTGREMDVLRSLEPKRQALESMATDTPAYTMTIPEDEIRVQPGRQRASVTIPEDEIRFQANQPQTSVTIPEDEIRFTPNAEPQPDPYQRALDAAARYQQGAAPGGRTVNFDALDAQDDAAAMASQQAAAANIAAQQQMPPPGTPQATAPAQPPAGTPSPPPSPPTAAPPTPPPAPTSLPEQQREADVRQATAPQGSRIPQDVRTAAMPEPEPALRTPAGPALDDPAAAAPPGAAESDEDAARRALRQERAMKAVGYILKLAGGLGGAALYNRGGSEIAAQMLARGLGGVGGALAGASPTQQQARIAQARAGDERRAQQGQELDLRRLAQQAAERRQSMLDEQGAQRLDLEGRRVAAMEEGLGLREQQIEAQAEAARALAEERGARGELARTRADEAAAARDPESPTSRQAQAELRALMARVPEDERISDDEIGALSASAADTLYNQVARRYGLRTRETRRGGAGGGGNAPMSAAEARQALVDRGLDPALADSLAPRELQRLLRNEAQRSLSQGETSEGIQVLPGVYATMELSAPEIRAIRDGFSAMRGGMLSLNRLNEIGQQYGGASARISRDAQARVVPELTILRSMVAQMGGTGVINPSEVPTINAALPNPGDLEQMTFGTFQSRLGTWQRILSDKVRATLDTAGVSGEGIDRALSGLRSGFGGGRNVTRFRGPDGAVYRLSDPRAIERARAAGWEAM